MKFDTSPTRCSHICCVCFVIAFASIRGARMDLDTVIVTDSEERVSAKAYVEESVSTKGGPTTEQPLARNSIETCRMFDCKIGFCSNKECFKLEVGSTGCDKHPNKKVASDVHCARGSCINGECRVSLIESGSSESCNGHNEWCRSGKCNDQENRCVTERSGSCHDHHECESNLCIQDSCADEKLLTYQPCQDGNGMFRNDWCASGLCNSDAGRCGGGKEGEQCSGWDILCETENCFNGRCAVIGLADGADCRHAGSKGCQSKLCMNGSLIGRCGKPLGNGESCEDDTWCKSSFCLPDASGAHWCRERPAMIGEYCDYGFHCLSNKCETPMWLAKRGERPKEKKRKICKNTGGGNHEWGRNGDCSIPSDNWCPGPQFEWCADDTRPMTYTYGRYGHQECWK